MTDTRTKENQIADGDERMFDVVAIAASTGGPAALEKVLGGLGGPSDGFDLPILVVQHMMPAFTREFSEWLSRNITLPVEIAAQGKRLKPGHVYLAPEDVHLKLVDSRTIGLSDEPKCGYHRPSANVLFDSVAEHFGARTLAVVLTGMGNDGVEGLVNVRAAGGRILVQDEESCVVFGMPGAAVTAGLADSVVPLDELSMRIRVLARSRQKKREIFSNKELSDPS